MALVSIFLLVVIITRIFQVYLFVKQVSRLCHIYDWRCVDENPLLLLDIVKDNYFVKSEWSAYNFLFLKGPSPLSMFFSFKYLTIENIYCKEALLRLKRYEIN
jgi:hypothetical protein